jgi:hypothetical protein
MYLRRVKGSPDCVASKEAMASSRDMNATASMKDMTELIQLR